MRLAMTIAALTISAAATPATAGPVQSTGVTGGDASFSNYQPVLALTDVFDRNGIYPAFSVGGLTDAAIYYPIGMVRQFAGGFSPGGQADGQHYSAVSNAAAYTIIGTHYGSYGLGDFAVPDLRGATIVGARSPDGQGAVANYQVGAAAGAATTTLSVAQLPPHSHSLPGGGTTSVVGEGAPVNHAEPSLTMTWLIATGGYYPSPGVTVQVGTLRAFAGDQIPQGWRPADGSLVSTTDAPFLAGIIGTTFGGDGVTTVGLPDLRGRTIVGVGTGNGLTPVTLGATFGSDAPTILTLANLPAHDHSLPMGTTGSVGGSDVPIDMRQPSLGLNYIIDVSDGAFPSRDVGLNPEINYLGEVVAYAGTVAPTGWAFADGSLVNLNQHTALFSLLGTYYGGDGRTTFALPDLRGRAIIGTSYTYRSGLQAGDQLGAEAVTLAVANLPSHFHTYDPDAVPEPASWALFIAGFGFVGAMGRHARRSNVVAG